MTDAERKFSIINRLAWSLLILWLVFAAMLIIGFATVSRAHAFEDHFWGPPAAAHKPKRKPQVKAWVKRDWPIHDDRPNFRDSHIPPPPGCRAPILVQGRQGITEKGAEEKARDAWSAEARARFGERMMDLRFAQGFQKRCYHSSVGDNTLKSMRDSIGERIGVVSDRADSNDAMEYRCEIFAAPCEPPWLGKGEDVKEAGAMQ